MIRRIAERYRLTRYNAGVIAVASVTLGTVLKNAGAEGALYGLAIAALVTLAIDVIVDRWQISSMIFRATNIRLRRKIIRLFRSSQGQMKRKAS